MRMTSGRRYQQTSARARALIAQGESARVDFKRSAEGISSEDFVSFANTDAGGVILVGIDEYLGINGEQLGKIIGCSVSDASILQITNKALSCMPPISIIIHIENLANKPFLRIEMPPSQTRPHCTPKGIYCRRDGSRNRPLLPNELLQIFMASEAQAFAVKFEAAADRITSDIGQLAISLAKSIEDMGEQLGWAEFKLDDSEDTLDSILTYSAAAQKEMESISTRLRALFRQDKRDDPIKDEILKYVINDLVDKLTKDSNLLAAVARGEKVSLQTSGKATSELNEADLQGAFQEAIKLATERAAKKASDLE